MDKIKIAQYWAAGCGGCDVAFLDIDEKILGIAEIADIVFWPIAVDWKLKDVEALPDGAITATFFNGAIRNSENEYIARLLRKKSQIMVAFGSCSCFGGIPGLANITYADDVLDYVYTKTPSSANEDRVFPTPEWDAPEGELELPELYDTVKTLDQILDVDYFMPGCPPTVDRINEFLDAVEKHVKEGEPLPPKGAVIASEKTLCDECPRTKEYRKIERVYLPHEIDPGELDPDLCLLDQGIVCMGPATRAGCGAKCIQVSQPCRGCFGPTRAALDHGGSMLSALASVFKVDENETKLSEDQIIELMSQIRDPLGTFYEFTMPKGLIKRAVREKRREKA
ncbi:MAG: oxidoreductase [Methanomassiliicoccales archaeon]